MTAADSQALLARLENERRSLSCVPPHSRVNLTAEGAIDLFAAVIALLRAAS